MRRRSDQAQVDRENPIRQRMAEEERILERLDKSGNRRIKMYFGGGAHFRNWVGQFVEVKGEENVNMEEVDSIGFQCYEKSGEEMYRVWVRESNVE